MTSFPIAIATPRTPSTELDDEPIRSTELAALRAEIASLRIQLREAEARAVHPRRPAMAGRPSWRGQ